ncbi:enoyl-CoA hydratase/isomerase family protein [Frankia sp. CNm7]|uniref:Enoyl-CoA hydratase/isomerase family protein n=1 Tax=Frankia nepalensis TaxID=1836974 RepID=A0A937UTL5_9ACTN|nr:enoyl-CoA hydratase-related protein [Frankia nepalensis]MBL7498692.1 enoyl-CoA hydratase/isomerase family protein [Frankia nepalensis]MBL7512914.1 enoyl-CoA hydratase/isomerase family protein [Frankia nepalensis]MBL7521648.1 enoyl-CoA hydratase/isomerase family protein [Frankia nepalensis]MBL7633223.1 enoyl-CoA hydratase/isomerase family protein [Frankia nepalensis]
MDSTLVERSDGLVTVVFNRPERKNALNAASWAALDRILAEVAVNPADRALLLIGAGGNFSSGADLAGGGDENSGLTGHGRQSILNEMRVVGDLINRLHRLPKPTIAAVDGVAVGVALGLALACDLIVASDRARFNEVFVRRGLSLDGGTSWSLPHQVGLRRAKQMAFFGDWVGAQEALAWGLVNEVVPAEDLPKVATAWGRRLAGGPTTALSMIKRLLDESGSSTFEQAVEDEARTQHIAYTTKDMAEGIRSFLERRDPEFTGI